MAQPVSFGSLRWFGFASLLAATLLLAALPAMAQPAPAPAAEEVYASCRDQPPASPTLCVLLTKATFNTYRKGGNLQYLLKDLGANASFTRPGVAGKTVVCFPLPPGTYQVQLKSTQPLPATYSPTYSVSVAACTNKTTGGKPNLP